MGSRAYRRKPGLRADFHQYWFGYLDGSFHLPFPNQRLLSRPQMGLLETHLHQTLMALCLAAERREFCETDCKSRRGLDRALRRSGVI